VKRFRRFAFLAVWACLIVEPSAAADKVLGGVNVEFELTNRDGETVRNQDFLGTNTLLAFGFTHCAHICPMIAAA